jgi:two-component system sensor histidine kinase CpxA
MRSLFFKIFLSFWISTTLMFTILALTAESRRSADVHEAFLNMFSSVTSVNGYSFAEAYERQGCAGLRQQQSALEQTAHIQSFLLDENGNSTCGQSPNAAAKGAASRAPEDGTVEFVPADRPRLGAKRIVTAAGHSYRFVLMWPRPDFRSLWWATLQRLMIAVPISGLVCFVLARYLTAPITRLRTAAQQIAEGDLTARAGTKTGRGGDEVGQLVFDFNHMAERLEILIGAQQRLIRDISHELRSPLTRLVLALGLARQSEAPNQVALDRIEKETERLNEMIERLLTLSRLESATEAPPKAPLSLTELVETVIADVEIEAKMRNCAVSYSAPRDYVLAANFELLRSALENVVRNAIRYTAEGTTVEVSAERTQATSPMEVVIRVRDHGPGVAEAELENLFRPFYRLDAARAQHTGGVGLGLTIAERAVKLHGGSIRATNAPSGGLVLELRLPISTGTVPASERAEMPAPQPTLHPVTASSKRS